MKARSARSSYRTIRREGATEGHPSAAADENPARGLERGEPERLAAWFLLKRAPMDH